MAREVISIFVENQANVLTRVASLFGQRGFNIDSLTVSTTDNPDISRITVSFDSTAARLDQIIKQTKKLASWCLPRYEKLYGPMEDPQAAPEGWKK